MTSAPTLPERARVVVIGGGVIGASVAYHLAHGGERDVLLLERDRLTSGTTWHAAGLMTCFGSFSETSTRLRLASRDLYARLEAETGQATGFRPVGLVEAAADADRLEEYRRVAAFQRRLGLEVEEVSPREMADLFPLARTDDLLAGFHVPGDGRVNPVDLTVALARGARNLGVRVLEGVSVTGVSTRPRGVVEEVTAVETDHGRVECEVVVNCAGMWARQLAERSGVVVPNQAAEHYYLVTEPIDGVSPDLPVFEDPSSYGYYREEGGGMMVGLFEPVAAAWRVDGIPEDFSFGTLPPDWDRMAPFLERAMSRVPVVETAGIRTFFCGPESFTPDLAPAVGEAPGVHGYFVAAGLNSVGVLSAGDSDASSRTGCSPGALTSTSRASTSPASVRGSSTPAAAPRARRRSSAPSTRPTPRGPSSARPGGCSARRCWTGSWRPAPTCATSRGGSRPRGTRGRAPRHR